MRNLLGAFGDAAVLFPLLAILSGVAGFSPWIPMATAGLAYIAAGIFFRVPMAVQPLKSIVIAGVATGAGSAEIRWSAVFVGAFCLLLLTTDIERWSSMIPSSIIHGIQAALGLLLILQGLKALGSPDFSAGFVFLIGTAGLVFLAGRRPQWPLLGAAGTLALLTGFGTSSEPYFPRTDDSAVRWGFVFSLALPQIALTLSNSVFATHDVCHRYFGPAAKAVTKKNLLGFIGGGNLVMAAVGGLPFCHGSGGVTAHYRGGARHWFANIVVGFFLLGLAAWTMVSGRFELAMPVLFLAILLATTGLFHIGLARPTWEAPGGRSKILLMSFVALATRNLLWVLIAGAALEGLERIVFKGKRV
jgi:hypothetical protein